MWRVIEPYWGLIRRMNVGLTVAVCLLMMIGVTFIYSACVVSESAEIRSLYLKQVWWIAAGGMAYLFLGVLDYRKLNRLAWVLYLGMLFLLALVLVIGTKKYGATRWLDLAVFRFQPSELAKLTTLILLARLMCRSPAVLSEVRSLLFMVGVIAVPFLLILVEPDLGTAMVFVPLAFILMFVSGVSLRFLGMLVLIGGVGVISILGFLFLPARLGMSEEQQEQLLAYSGLRKHQVERIRTFVEPDKDPLGAGWNKNQSKIAVGSGGLTGKGFRQGTQNILGFLPKAVAHTDFIYSVIAEERGFIGSFSVLLLFGIIVIIGFQIAVMARDRLGRLLCIGVTTLIFCHVFINIAMTIGLMPVTGLPLPLLSYGGTFMIVTMSGLGIVQSVYVRSRSADSTFVA